MNRLGKKRVPYLFVLDFGLKEPLVIPLEDIDPGSLLYSFPTKTLRVLKTPRVLALDPHPPNYNNFKDKFNQVQEQIQAGNTYLLNLCFKTPVEMNAGLKDVFEVSRAPYKLWLKDRFVLFSPESFVRINKGIIRTYPMKGTLEKTGPDSEKILLNDEKEAAEHATIVDLLRNDLGRVSTYVRVKRYRYIDEIKTREKTLLQVSSEIEGVLDEHFRENHGDLFRELLPAGSVTGAPKEKTVEIIKSVESFERGFYTGVFGIFDGENIDSAVMIRFIEEENGSFYYKSGGGITFMSDPEKEYNEIIQKIYVPVY
jgi:para-aminobenzoate synthetase component 1